MKTIWEYKELFHKKGIDISEEEIEKIINNIDSIWNLLFTKYINNIDHNLLTYE